MFTARIVDILVFATSLLSCGYGPTFYKVCVTMCDPRHRIQYLPSSRRMEKRWLPRCTCQLRPSLTVAEVVVAETLE